jgi:alanine-glyoxylate transaminase/serine-glyoxylate transaminase/serine-pyruvate transaminase
MNPFEQQKKLVMIPGPVEFHPLVVAKMGTGAVSHVDPSFIASFGNALKKMRTVLGTSGQPLVLSGSGTLGWDVAACNFVTPGQHVLCISTGLFGTWFAESCRTYGAVVDVVEAAFGSKPTESQILEKLKSKPYKMVTVTHVDTSTGVLQELPSLVRLIKSVQPDTLVCVDGVCSIGAEEFHMDAWGVDIVLTASQKAIGVPPGLLLMAFSENAMSQIIEKPSSYYASLRKWVPIMQNYEHQKGSYFATPPVQLILALETSLELILQEGMEVRVQRHREASMWFKSEMEKRGYKQVPVEGCSAHTLTALYYPDHVNGTCH